MSVTTDQHLFPDGGLPLLASPSARGTAREDQADVAARKRSPDEQ